MRREGKCKGRAGLSTQAFCPKCSFGCSVNDEGDNSNRIFFQPNLILNFLDILILTEFNTLTLGGFEKERGG